MSQFKAYVWTFSAFFTMALPQALASDHHKYGGEGQAFDFSIETTDGKATMYVAQKPLNEPHSGSKPRFIPDDEKLQPMVFDTTADPGIFVAKFEGEFPEGQVEVEVNGVKEAVDANIVEADVHGGGGHDHAHGAARKSPGEILRSAPVLATGFLGVFLIGLLLGRNGRRSKPEHVPFMKEAHADEGVRETVKRSSAILICALLGAAFAGSKAQADEGHTHDTIDINAGGAAGEVSISKKSQFLINLRTKPAVTAPVRETLETFGHLAPKPQLDAAVRASNSGFVHFNSDHLLGSKVSKGEVLGRLEWVGNVEIKAPISGTVVEVSAVSGIRLNAGDPIVRIVNSSTLWIDAEVFQKDLERLKDAKTVSIMVEGTALPIPGRILGIKSAIDEKTFTAKVYVEVDNSAGLLPLGALANVTFELPTTFGGGMSFPKGTVLNRGGEKIVFVQTGPESFLGKPVATRFGSEPGTIVVVKGLDEGERVVVSGGYQVLVGAK